MPDSMTTDYPFYLTPFYVIVRLNLIMLNPGACELGQKQRYLEGKGRVLCPSVGPYTKIIKRKKNG